MARQKYRGDSRSRRSGSSKGKKGVTLQNGVNALPNDMSEMSQADPEEDYSKPPRRHLVYPEKTMTQMVEDIARRYPDSPAYEFFGARVNYAAFIRNVERTARALMAVGIREGEAVTVCLPNTPQALEIFYGINRIRAVANMVHPLSAQQEICFYLSCANSRLIVTLDMFYEKVKRACEMMPNPVRVIVCRMEDALPVHLKAAYFAKEGRKYVRFPDRKTDLTWKKFIRMGDIRENRVGISRTKTRGSAAPAAKGKEDRLPPYLYDRYRTAVVLYSGGTSGRPKGICLTDLNFNALAMQCKEAIRTPFGPGLTMLSCMPLFHGFGLGINIHTILAHGLCCILMPTFTIRNYSDMLIKRRPNFIAGVPNLFSALLSAPALEKADLSFLMGMFCGGDALSLELKERADRFLKEHGAGIQVREGYGLTECVTASCLTPKDTYRPHSIGLPFPDTVYDIVWPGTDDSLPAGEKGEIVLKGPTLMLEYLHEPEETDKTLRRRSDGDIWLYTGDLGYMDQDGYVYFTQRIKRVIVTNGYNVYPGQIEDELDRCPVVSYSCVIGVPDERRGQKVKAFVVLKDGKLPENDEVREKLTRQITEWLQERVAGYAMPREYEFRTELPRTLVGKVAYRLLEESQAEAGKRASENGNG